MYCPAWGAGVCQHLASAELLSYQPVKPVPESTPPVVEPPLPPKEIKTVDELYHIGLRLEQFHNAALEPYAYFEEALSRDPGNYEVNTALGRLYSERGLWRQASERLTTALARATRNYTRPKDGEAYYYLGVTLRGEGKDREAEDAFHRAAWSEAWTAASYEQLAELGGQRGDWPQALSDLDHSLAYNTLNCRAWDLKSAVLRRMGRADDSKEAAKKAVAVNPLDLWGLHELGLLDANSQPQSFPGNTVQANLELAMDYYEAGLGSEAEQVLKQLVAASPDRNRVNPLVYYDLGYLAMQSGQPGEAARYFHLAAQMPTDYVFPFRLEEVKVLEAAMQANPGDARAPYYLGNLLYDRQPDVAIKEWEKSAAIDNTFSLVHRNLAQGYEASQNDNRKATIASMERAVALDQNNARLRFELDMLYEAGNVTPQKRLASFESNPALAAKRSDAMTQEAKVYLLVGRYEQALRLLKTHRFHNWEGYGDVHEVYMDACLLAGESELHAGKFNEALGDFQAALEYPENLEVGKPYHEGRRPEIDYWLGVAYGKLGKSAESMEMFRQAVASPEPEQGREQPEMLYYAGLAAQRLGRSAEATRFFGELIGRGDEALATRPEADYFAKFGQRRSSSLRLAEAHYLIGLGNLGMGEEAKARGEFQAALSLNVNHLGATTQLSSESSRTVASK